MSDEATPPYKISTHERCSDPCPAIRERVDDHPDFDGIGLWGPFIETADGEEKLAEGHAEVQAFLDDYLAE